MAKYYITDFYKWEQPLIDQLRKEGKYVYGLRDADSGNGFSIFHRVYVNNIGFIITDEPLPLIDDVYLNDNDFYKLGWEEDCSLKEVYDDISAQLESVKAEYKKKEKQSKKEWNEIIKYQNMCIPLEQKYKMHLYCRHRNRKLMEENHGKKNVFITPYYEDNKEIILQYVHIDRNTKEDEQEIGYFIAEEITGRTITESKIVTVKRNCQLRTILKAIEKQEGLIRKKSYKIERG